MRRLKGRESVLIVDGEADRWLVTFRDGWPAILRDGKPAIFDTEAEAVKWAWWTLNEHERMAADELGEDDDED
ncbi:MAG: hypothetical protein ABW199_12580 [Caulobacterales bacterium]